MTSAIDPTKPATGNPQTADVRENFSAAKNEIEALQATVAALDAATFTPTVYGATTAGTCTYTTQIGYAQVIGGVCHFRIHLAWTGHTGTGTMRVGGLPYTSATGKGASLYPIRPIGLAAGAGKIPFAGNAENTDYLNCTTYDQAAGTQANLAIAAAVSSLIIQGTYPVP